MKPEFVASSPFLNHLISYYLILRSDEQGITFKDKFIPDGHIGIVFLIRVEKAFVYTDIKRSLDPYFLVIPKIMPLSIEISLPGEALIVICKASVLTSVFNILFDNPAKTPDLTIDLFKGYQVLEKFRSIDNTNDRIQFFENYLLQNFPVSNYKPDPIDLAYNKVMDSDGNITVNEIIKSLEINYRTFRRNFPLRVGISLKGLIRIVRVKYLWKLIMENKISDFQSVVVMGKFHDQAHLINDFKKIVGETPKAFFSRNLDNVKIFSGLKD